MFNESNIYEKVKEKSVNHYKLDDGRIWSIKDAKFVPAVSEDDVLGICPDEQGTVPLLFLVEGTDKTGKISGDRIQLSFALSARTDQPLG